MAQRSSEVPETFSWLRLLPALSIAAMIGMEMILARGWDNHFVSDDWKFLYTASTMQSPQELLSLLNFSFWGFIRPIQYAVTYALYSVFQLDPAGYHLTMQVLDLANAFMAGLFTFQVSALGAFEKKSIRTVVSIGVSLLFLFSWRRHEAIYWYSGGNEILLGFFKLLTINVVAWWLNARARYWLVLPTVIICTALAILSKESGVLLPAEVLLLMCVLRFAARLPKVSWGRALFLVACQVAVISIWAYNYIPASARTMFGEIERGGLSTLHAPLNVWAVRFLQYLNGNYLGLSSITYEMHNRLLLELVPIGFLVILALKRRQHLWILALGWTLLAAAPYVAVVPPNATAQQAIQNVIGGDRYLYYSAAGASLLLVVSLMWLGSEIKRLHIVRLEQGYGLVAVALMVVYLLANAARLLAYEKDWDTAGRIGQSVIAQVRQEAPAPANKEAMCFINLPDNFHGKYILRNGLAYALYLTYGQHDFDVRRYATTLQLADAEGTEKAQACTRVFVYDNVKQNLSRTR